MSHTNEELVSYVSHEVRNKLAVALGYSQMNVESEEDVMQREAVESFSQSYERFERVLEELGEFDDQLIDEMKDTDSIYDDKIQACLDSSVESIRAVEAFFSEDQETASVKDIFGPFEGYGEVLYESGVEDEQINTSYRAVVSTMTSNYLEHAQPEADRMFAVLDYSEDGEDLTGWVGDNGLGLSDQDLVETGLGTELINRALEDGDEYEVFTRDEISGLELPDLPVPQEEIGWLSRLQVRFK